MSITREVAGGSTVRAILRTPPAGRLTYYVRRWVFGTTTFAAIGAGVVGGVLLAFSTFLMQVLDERPASEAITTMSSINEKIENPLFLLAFMGTALAGVVLAAYAWFRLDGPARTWLVAGGAVYVIGALLVTMAYHSPRTTP